VAQSKSKMLDVSMFQLVDLLKFIQLKKISQKYQKNLDAKSVLNKFIL